MLEFIASFFGAFPGAKRAETFCCELKVSEMNECRELEWVVAEKVPELGRRKLR